MKAKKIFAGTMAALMTMLGASALAADTSYSDVKSADWFAPAVKTATAHKLMNGVGGDSFAPYGTMNRAMIVQVLYNQSGQPEIHSGNAFHDVTADQWYYKAVQWASENNIASGVGDGNFAPNKNVTRQEFAVFLNRYCGSKSSNASLAFGDADSVANWAQNAMSWAVENSIIKGSKQDDGSLLLNPTGYATRGEAAQMLSNYLNASGGHIYGENVEKTADCTHTGTKTLICSMCGNTKSEQIPATGHKYDDGKITTKPTCTTDGVKTFTCSVCGDTKTEKVTATGHKYDNGVITTKATCTKTGVKTYTCSSCNETKTETIPAIGHKYSEKITKAATCTKDGEKTLTCSNCNDVKKETIPALGHKYSEKITKPATCTEDGVKTLTCSTCGDVKTEKIPATGHNYSDGMITKEATCTEEGVKTFICQTCRNVKTESMPKIAHNYEAVYDNVWVATKRAYDEKVKDGYTPGYRCNNCYEEFETSQELLDHWELAYRAIMPDKYPNPYKGTDVDPCPYIGVGNGDSNVKIWNYKTVHHDEEGSYKSMPVAYKCTSCGKEAENVTKTFVVDIPAEDEVVDDGFYLTFGCENCFNENGGVRVEMSYDEVMAHAAEYNNKHKPYPIKNKKTKTIHHDAIGHYEITLNS